jgi:hypothetical protein
MLKEILNISYPKVHVELIMMVQFKNLMKKKSKILKKKLFKDMEAFL